MWRIMALEFMTETFLYEFSVLNDMLNKKGAIEFSITTVIVIIIGIAVLALALGFSQGLFSQVEDITQDAFANARSQLAAKLTNANNVVVSPQGLTLSANEQTTVSVGCLNTASDSKPATLVGVADGNKFTATASEGPSGNVEPGSKTYWGLVIKANSDDVSTTTQPEVMSLGINCNGVTETRPLTITYE